MYTYHIYIYIYASKNHPESILNLFCLTSRGGPVKMQNRNTHTHTKGHPTPKGMTRLYLFKPKMKYLPTQPCGVAEWFHSTSTSRAGTSATNKPKNGGHVFHQRDEREPVFWNNTVPDPIISVMRRSKR